jgi:SAM-dependent methyltransferase
LSSAPATANKDVWARGSFFDEFQSRDLRPVEVDILLRYRDDLAGRVIELGSGAGRIVGYLIQIAREVHGVDISPRMIEYSRRTWPEAVFHHSDFSDLSVFEDATFDVVLATCNILDVLTDAERRTMLDAIHRVLVPGGLLVMSAHNRSYLPNVRTPMQLRANLSHPRAFLIDVMKLPRRLRNRRRLLPLEQHTGGYEIVNDGSYDFSLLHYFIARDDQERQLRDHGFELLESLDLEGRAVAPGEAAAETVELHYVARRD